MGGVIDILGARVTPDGKVPVLETRHRFYCTQQVTKVNGTDVGVWLGSCCCMTRQVMGLRLLHAAGVKNCSRSMPAHQHNGTPWATHHCTALL